MMPLLQYYGQIHGRLELSFLRLGSILCHIPCVNRVYFPDLIQLLDDVTKKTHLRELKFGLLLRTRSMIKKQPSLLGDSAGPASNVSHNKQKVIVSA